jgi:hypothetical protein
MKGGASPPLGAASGLSVVISLGAQIKQLCTGYSPLPALAHADGRVLRDPGCRFPGTVSAHDKLICVAPLG